MTWKHWVSFLALVAAFEAYWLLDPSRLDRLERDRGRDRVETVVRIEVGFEAIRRSAVADRGLAMIDDGLAGDIRRPRVWSDAPRFPEGPIRRFLAAERCPNEPPSLDAMVPACPVPGWGAGVRSRGFGGPGPDRRVVAWGRGRAAPVAWAGLWSVPFDGGCGRLRLLAVPASALTVWDGQVPSGPVAYASRPWLAGEPLAAPQWTKVRRRVFVPRLMAPWAFSAARAYRRVFPFGAFVLALACLVFGARILELVRPRRERRFVDPRKGPYRAGN